jgi:alcohol dehydrogenase-like protein
MADLVPGDRVVMPFQISCGHCFMCEQNLQTQCETTQVREHGMGAALYGYTKLYGQGPGGQAQYLRVPYANYNRIKVPDGPPDERFVPARGRALPHPSAPARRGAGRVRDVPAEARRRGEGAPEAVGGRLRRSTLGAAGGGSMTRA